MQKWRGLRGRTILRSTVVQSVAKNLPANHFTHRLLDEDVARSWCEQFLMRLDPNKLYFRQPDVDGFRNRQKDLPH